jgi:hypothetical protein
MVHYPSPCTPLLACAVSTQLTNKAEHAFNQYDTAAAYKITKQCVGDASDLLRHSFPTLLRAIGPVIGVRVFRVAALHVCVQNP